jgi:hypothetical protein
MPKQRTPVSECMFSSVTALEPAGDSEEGKSRLQIISILLTCVTSLDNDPRHAERIDAARWTCGEQRASAPTF